ncbi:MAG: glycosyltransferase [Deltaproteobacteria bacterium]|nr:glycosyltransferase [Deltaproteobacteria bacterium]
MAFPGTRIVHIIKVKGVSGAENHLLTLLSELRRDVQIHLIMLVEMQNPMTDFVSDFKKNGVEVTRIVINHHSDFSLIWKIYYLIRKIRPHIVHTHLLHADLYGVLSAVLAGTKIMISTKHGYDDYEKTSFFYKLNSISSRWLNRVITISDALQVKVAEAEGIPKSKMATIYYGLDGETYASNRDAGPARSCLNATNDACLIGTVGRLIPVKGYEILLKAVAGIELDFRLLIMGDGPLKGRLEKISLELGLSDKVKFLGFISEVSPMLSGLDIFVLPTLGEGFGLVLLEAMAHRLPIVSTNTMAVPEIVEDRKTGILVPPKDAAALKEAIETLIRSTDQRAKMGKRGWEKLIKTFSVDKMVYQTGSLYQELLDGYRRDETHAT